MVTDDRVSVADAGDGARHDVGLRTVAADEVEVHGRQALETMRAVIARERNGFQEHLREHDRRSAVQIDAVFEPRDVRDEVAEVAQAALADRGTRCVRCM